jgi:hypothetical protein
MMIQAPLTGLTTTSMCNEPFSVEVARTSAPVPSMMSTDCNVVGAGPVAGVIVGALACIVSY